jgi:hypothetical protein
MTPASSSAAMSSVVSTGRLMKRSVLTRPS